MSSPADIGVGSISDKIHAVALTLKECQSLAGVQARYCRLMLTLDHLADRIAGARRRGSVPLPVAPALKWLDCTVRELPALDGDSGEVLRAELRAAIARLRLLAGR
jgi:hypothetical protein